MQRLRKIQILLRLAELCTPEQEARKRQYMDQIDGLLRDDADDTSEQLQSDSVMKFLASNIEEKMSGEVLRPLLYTAYVKFCFGQNIPSLRKSDFFNEIRSLGFSERKRHDGRDYFIGMQIR